MAEPITPAPASPPVAKPIASGGSPLARSGPPLGSERWSIREFKGTREKAIAAITDYRLTDPKTGQRGAEPLPEPVRNYLLWILGNLEGDVFIIDAHVHATTKSDWSEHLHISKFC